MKNLHVQKLKLEHTRKSLSYTALNGRNIIPQAIRNAETIAQFKKELKSHLFFLFSFFYIFNIKNLQDITSNSTKLLYNISTRTIPQGAIFHVCPEAITYNINRQKKRTREGRATRQAPEMWTDPRMSSPQTLRGTFWIRRHYSSPQICTNPWKSSNKILLVIRLLFFCGIVA